MTTEYVTTEYGKAKREYPRTSEIVKLYSQGWSGAAVARHVGCSPATVRRIVRQYGIKRRDQQIPRVPADQRPADPETRVRELRAFVVEHGEGELAKLCEAVILSNLEVLVTRLLDER